MQLRIRSSKGVSSTHSRGCAISSIARPQRIRIEESSSNQGMMNKGGMPSREYAVASSMGQECHVSGNEFSSSRRQMLFTASLLLGSGSLLNLPASAVEPPTPGFRLINDKIDGYSFRYPENWLAVTSSGNDCSLRNPRNIDENLFVSISSPSSSRYNSTADLGTPADAAAKIMDQYLTQEFMSTRIGITREGKVLSAVERTGSDGLVYYDLAIRMTSYASKNPYVATREELMKDYGVEWDRILLTTLGVANKRLYELRIQTAADTFDSSMDVVSKIKGSFRVKEVDPDL